MSTHSTAIVVGAGIVGMATARALALKGYKVTVIERTSQAVGASIRNFGMLWPIGQPDGTLYNRALRSKNIWKEVADTTGLWYDECGSLHVATTENEWTVLQELEASFKNAGRDVELMNPSQLQERFTGLQDNIIGGLFSPVETIVDPRKAIPAVANYLETTLDVKFIWGKLVNHVSPGKVMTGSKTYRADAIFVCSGADFETLYPEIFASFQITKCKLQMMRFAPPSQAPRIGTSVCGGLSLIHYDSFRVAPSLGKLKKSYEQELPEYLKWHIHVMVSQNDAAELTVGDSHEYGHTFDPFDKAHINTLVMDYLKTFMKCSDWKLVQSWNGIYPKLTDGKTEIFSNPEPGVFIVNGIGGAGMTLSFGLAEEVVSIF